MTPSNADLAGLDVDVVVNEPWDLTSSDGSVRFQALVVKAATFASGADDERLLVRFREPVDWHGTSYRYFVARHRRGHGLVDELRNGERVECSLLAVSDEDASSLDVLDVSQWRGGLAVRAMVEPRT